MTTAPLNIESLVAQYTNLGAGDYRFSSLQSNGAEFGSKLTSLTYEEGPGTTCDDLLPTPRAVTGCPGARPRAHLSATVRGRRAHGVGRVRQPDSHGRPALLL